jgi:hypothetical protein
LERGVTIGTAKGYQSHVDRWKAFASSSRFDPLLLDLNDEQAKIHVINFIRNYRYDTSIAMTALRWYLTTHIRPTYILDDQAIRYAKRAARDQRSSGRQRSEDLSRVRRTPIPYEMIKWMRDNMWTKGIDSRMTYLGVAFAFTYLLRVSSYASSSSNYDHALRSDDVMFIMDDGTKKLAWELRDDLSYSDHDVKLATFTFRTDKTHQAGFVRVEKLTRLSLAEAQLLEDMFNFARESGADQHQEFFSRWKSNRHKKLNRNMVSCSLKDAGTALGLSTEKLSSHGARIGGATELSVAGFEDAVIKVIGCWDSRASLIYQQNTEHTPNPLRVGSAGQGMSLDSVRSVQRPSPRIQSTPSSTSERTRTKKRSRAASGSSDSNDDHQSSESMTSISGHQGLRLVRFDTMPARAV